MCLIAVRRKDNESLIEKFYDIAKNKNSDGIGIMYAKEGRVIAKKAEGRTPNYKKLALYKEFSEAPAPSCLHLRFGTAGNKDDETNAHPFQILDFEKDGVDLFMMHNGHFSSVAKVDPTKSDTWHFANLYIKKLVKKNPYILCDPFVQEMIKDYIKGSRVVFLYGDGTRIILDDGTGCEEESKGGAWLSNRYTTEGYTNVYTPPSNNNNRVKGDLWSWEKEKDRKAVSRISPYDPDDWSDDYCYGGYSHRHKEVEIEEEEETKVEKTQQQIEDARAKYPLALTDKDSDNPDIQDSTTFEMPETVDEAMEALAGMNDDSIKELVEVQPEDVINLLLTFRDFYIYHNVNPLSKCA